MRSRHVVLPLAITTLAASAGIAHDVLPAAALPCSGTPGNPGPHQDMFTANRLNTTWVIGWGTFNQMEVFDRTDNPACVNGEAQNWSAAHMMLGGHPEDQYEVGYRQGRNAAGVRIQQLFTEYTAYGNWQWTNYYNMPAGCPWSPAQGTFRNYKVINFTGNYFRAYFDCQDGSGWHLLETALTNWHSGFSTGEAGRYTFGTPSAMNDLQQSLARTDSAGNWASWTNAICYSDEAPNWTPHTLSATSYSVIPGTPAC